jgi:hypothetical protein
MKLAFTFTSHSRSQPAAASQPASERPLSALDHFQHQIPSRSTKPTTFAYALFQAFNSRKQQASQPAGLRANQPIQYFAGRVTTSAYQNAFEI